MADKKYTININLSDGRTQKLPFTAPQGPAGEGLSDNEKTFIDNLMTSTSVDSEGNFVVGKNLEVDGEATINTKLISVDNAFNRVTIPTINAIRMPNGSDTYNTLGNYLDNTYSKIKYQHTIKIRTLDNKFNMSIYASIDSNTTIDSVTDLVSILPNDSYIANGIINGDNLLSLVTIFNNHGDITTSTFTCIQMTSLTSPATYISIKASEVFNSSTGVRITDDVRI